MTSRETVSEVKQRLRSAVENSALTSVSNTLARGFETSILNGVCTRVIEVTRASRLYRWLTTEPEPDVIVIDLRETYTVGPFIAVLDVIAPRMARFWQNSGLASVAGSVNRILSGSKVAALAVNLLEPPEPPENRKQRD
jgi:hypothetical protein